MKAGKFFKVFSESARRLVRAPILIVASLVLGILFFLISQLGAILAVNFQTTLSNILWTAAVGLVSVLLVGFFSAGMFGVLLKRKNGAFFSFGKKFLVRNFVVVLVVLVLGILLGRIVHYVALFIGRALSLNVATAVIVYLILYFASLVGILIFFAFSSVLLVVKNLSVKNALAESVGFVKRNYLATLSLIVIFYVLFYLFDKIPGYAGDILMYALLLPYFVVVLERFASE